jgi:hypothetical protein
LVTGGMFTTSTSPDLELLRLLAEHEEIRARATGLRRHRRDRERLDIGQLHV